MGFRTDFHFTERGRRCAKQHSHVTPRQLVAPRNDETRKNGRREVMAEDGKRKEAQRGKGER